MADREAVIIKLKKLQFPVAVVTVLFDSILA